MLVSVLLAGDGADMLAGQIAQAGAAVDVLGAAEPGEGFDLAVLLADPGQAESAAIIAVVDRLARASERLLFVPLPLGQPAPLPEAMMERLTGWFALFADRGYQPVVEFDAGFLSAGAFLVDRGATAAEGELSAFTDRLQFGQQAASVQLQAVEESERVAIAERDTLRADLATAQAELADLRAVLAQQEAALAQATAYAAQVAAEAEARIGEMREIAASNAGWEALRGWARAEASRAGRDTPEALARDLPGLRGLGMAPNIVPDLAAKRRGFASLFVRRPQKPIPLLDDSALVRASPLFDAAWYVASNPDVGDPVPIDPVFHYLLIGSPRGADPGPCFDSAAYAASHPGLEICPLVHALRHGELG
jgi:hypothetical protein